MKKLIKLFILLIILIIIISFSLCIKKLFPTLIPFMLLSNILIRTNIINDISDSFKYIMNKIFKVNKNCAFAFIMGMISGTPSNAKYLKDLSQNNLINDKDIQNSLNFIHYTNPIFILQTIGSLYLKDKKLGLIILISHFISAFIIGIFNKKSYDNIIVKKSNNNNNENIFNIFIESIKITIDTLLLILGIITVFLMFTTILNCFIKIDNNYKFIYGLFEITQGLHYLSTSNFNIIIKSSIASFLISFGGFCIHMQVFSIIDNKKIRYLPYLKSRIIHGILSIIFTFILTSIMY